MNRGPHDWESGVWSTEPATAPHGAFWFWIGTVLMPFCFLTEDIQYKWKEYDWETTEVEKQQRDEREHERESERERKEKGEIYK